MFADFVARKIRTHTHSLTISHITLARLHASSRIVRLKFYAWITIRLFTVASSRWQSIDVVA